MKGKTAVLVGASGLVGNEILQILLQDPHYEKVTLLVRKTLSVQHPKVTEIIFDFEQMDATLVQGDDLFCALGTTLKVAGSKEAQYKIDCLYPLELGKIARANGFKGYHLVSSIGADAHSGNFYLRTKGELEKGLDALQFPLLSIARPSFLLGQRKENRIGERIGIILVQFFRILVPKKYRGVTAFKVAKCLVNTSIGPAKGLQVFESDQIQDIK